ncbi:MAG: beta-galactosidase, partial [Halieaceae bacterium]|nr:beta-galactosidase [Halieaceae bacterium]
RQAKFAQEQMHAGLLRPDRSRSDAWQEIETVVAALKTLESESLPQPQAQVALVTDVSAQWVSDIEQQGQEVEAHRVTFQFYRALRQLNVTVDIVSPAADLSQYALVVVASMPIVSDTLLEACEQSDATLLFGPRCGAKTEEFQIPTNRAPGVLQSWLDLQVNSVETLRPDVAEPFEYKGKVFQSRLWCEDLAVTNATIEAFYQDKRPALVRKGRCLYLATLTDDAFLRQLLGDLLTEREIVIQELPEDVRMMTRGSVTFAFNYGKEAHTLDAPPSAQVLAGSAKLPPRGFCIWRSE